MSDDLGRLMQATEGEGPSPEFRARLRAQIVAETGETAPDVANDVVVVLDLTSNDDPTATRRAKPRFGLLVACAAAVLAIAGVWVSLTNDDDPSPVDVTTEMPQDDGVPAEPITADNTVFEDGRYRIDTLGTPFTFTGERQVGTLVNDDGVVSITSLTSANADDATITFRRTDLLPDPATPTARVESATAWPATDIAGWLDRVGDELSATVPVETTLGGLPATTVQLDFVCDGGPCRAGDLQNDPGLPMFTPGSTYRLWVVDQGAEDPIVITIAADRDTDPTWFDTAETLLASLEFEAIEPNPVQRGTSGPVEIDAFDGLRLTVPSEATVVQPYPGFARIAPQDVSGDVEFLTRPLDVDGVEITSIERTLELLEDEAVAITELDPTDVGGRPARVFRVDSGPFPNVVAKTRPEDLARGEFGWESPQFGHLWLVETADRGLLVVSAETMNGPDAVEPLFVWAQDLLASLELVGP